MFIRAPPFSAALEAYVHHTGIFPYSARVPENPRRILTRGGLLPGTKRPPSGGLARFGPILQFVSNFVGAVAP